MKKSKMRTLTVAMSGGADSLMTAVLLMEKGYDVRGIHMIVTEEEYLAETNSFEKETSHYSNIRKSIHLIEQRLNIPIDTVDLRQEFDEKIIRPFISSYLSGQTPNPCIDCNAFFKFGILQKFALEQGMNAFATGHYARVVRSPSSGRCQIVRGVDRNKEQSYFLHRLTQQQLRHLILPLGTKTKKQVYTLLQEKKFANIPLKESQEICFIQQNDYRNFIRRKGKVKDSRGVIIDQTGKVVGKHKGIFAYTIGQRRGIGIPSATPFYVTEVYPETNTIKIGCKEDLFKKQLSVGSVNWVSIEPPAKPFNASVQIRYRHKAAGALITPVSDSMVVVKFKKPQLAITPGQSAVFYKGDILLGGGQIKKVNS